MKKLNDHMVLTSYEDLIKMALIDYSKFSDSKVKDQIMSLENKILKQQNA